MYCLQKTGTKSLKFYFNLKPTFTPVCNEEWPIYLSKKYFSNGYKKSYTESYPGKGRIDTSTRLNPSTIVTSRLLSTHADIHSLRQIQTLCDSKIGGFSDRKVSRPLLPIHEQFTPLYSAQRNNLLLNYKGYSHILCIQHRYLHTSLKSYIRNNKLINDTDSFEFPKDHDLAKLGTGNLNIKRDVPSDKEEINEEGFEIDCIESNTKFQEHPKNIVHSFYNVLSQELKNDFNLSPTYSKVRNDWQCTYYLRWPEPMKIIKRASSKKEASHKAAIAVLTWLKQKNKIDSTGKPLIYDSATVKTLFKKSNRKALHLDDFTMNKLELLYETHKSNLFTYMEEDKRNDEDNLPSKGATDLENSWLLGRAPQKFSALNDYTTSDIVKLPIQDFKSDIIDLINKEKIVILKGETGCGKSIRVPQYVLEALSKSKNFGQVPCRVIVTQPRRIAAVSLAERVAFERNEAVGKVVGYQVRFKSNFNSTTGHILYCTTGILLRRLQTDPTLSECSHIILDEAHERDINTDLLMNLLQYALRLNPNLKLVVMSATINTDIFQQYFKDAAVFHVPGITYPVKEYYIGSIKGVNLDRTSKMCESNEPHVVMEDIVGVIQHIHKEKPEGAILCFLPSWEDISRVAKALPSTADMEVYCLHSKLDIAEQQKVFSRTADGVRKVILSTNIAETSVTIDDIVYVVDTGIQKQTKFDAEKGVMCLDQSWISQANVRQRKGRAGRVRPGESFHLYPRSLLEKFIKYPIPEILRSSLTKIVLDSKVYSNNMNAVEFLSQLPTAPSESAILQAVKDLQELELLDDNERLTPLGYTLSNFQMEPKLSKVIVNSIIFQCVTPIIDIVTLFSEETNIFSSVLVDRGDVKDTKTRFSKTSDHMAMVKIFEKWLGYIENRNRDMASMFCHDHNLRDYKLYTLQKLRNVYFDYIYRGFNKEVLLSDRFSNNEELVKAVLLSDAGSILRRSNIETVKGRLKKKDVLLTRNNHKVNITSESVNSRTKNFSSDFLVYINETRSNIRRTTTVRETSVIALLSVLLFKSEELLMKEIPRQEYSDELDSEDQVILALKNARVECICDRSHAKAILRCREALKAGIIYYTSQLTGTEERNLEVDAQWEKMLNIVCFVLSAHKT